MADKFPFMQMYTHDWLGDECLSQCKPATRGIWADILMNMHQAGRTGVLDGFPEGLSRSCRCSVDELNEACQDLKATKTAGVRYSNGRVTITNRRMQAEHKKREDTRLRVNKHRHPEGEEDAVTKKEASCNADVTGYISESILQSIEKKEEKDNPLSPLIEKPDDEEDGSYTPATAPAPSGFSKGDHDMTRKLCLWILQADGREIREGSDGFKFRLQKIVAPMRKEYKNDARFQAVFDYYDSPDKLGGIPIAGEWDFKNNFSKLEGRMRNTPSARHNAECERIRARIKAAEKDKSEATGHEK